MTPKRAAILAYITGRIAADGYAPSLAELACRFGISVPVMHGHVTRLAKDGHLERTPYEARSLAIPDDAKVVAASRLAALATVLARAGLAEYAADAEEIRLLLAGKVATV